MVHVGKSRDVPPRRYHDGTNVSHAEKRILVGPRENAPTFCMRKFTLRPGGFSPHHAHPWEHEVYVLDGVGEVRSSDEPRRVEPGDYVFVPPDEIHQFVNAGPGLFEFLCMVPLAGEDG